MVAEAGLEPATFGLWGRRATTATHSAIWKSTDLKTEPVQARSSCKLSVESFVPLAGISGFEPKTTWLTVRRSTSLSYTPIYIYRTQKVKICVSLKSSFLSDLDNQLQIKYSYLNSGVHITHTALKKTFQSQRIHFRNIFEFIRPCGRGQRIIQSVKSEIICAYFFEKIFFL